MVVKILHIFLDDKFFDSTSTFFDSLRSVENYYYFYSKDKSPFKYIRRTDRIKIFYDEKEYIKTISQSSMDIVYLHSLSPTFYKYILSIPKECKIIWWAWGYDLYYDWRGCKSFISLPLYKEKTINYTQKSGNTFTSKVKHILRKLKNSITYLADIRIRNKVLLRIDYFTPVIDLEFEMMKTNRSFRAQPFMLRRGPGRLDNVPFESLTHNKSMNILVGNSLTLTNNHLDVWEYVKDCYRDENQEFIFPVSYGNEIDIRFLKSVIKGNNIRWLENFMPISEYNQLQTTVTHAVFGVIRQQAMVNIFRLLRNGVKVFLFKDSIVYKYLKNRGYIVYCIEDMDKNSFLKPLSQEDAITNYELEFYRSNDNEAYAESELVRIMTK